LDGSREEAQQVEKLAAKAETPDLRLGRRSRSHRRAVSAPRVIDSFNTFQIGS
jgi:hypothetical protein